jgi:hypothetical protein
MIHAGWKTMTKLLLIFAAALPGALVGISVQAAPSLSGPVATSAAPNSVPPTTLAPASPLKKVIFRPPGDESGGILPIRVGGGSRGGPSNGLSLEVLVPDQVALTTQAQPSLYWYQSKGTETPCEVTLIEPKNPKPLLVLETAEPTPQGIHAVRLGKFKVQLKPNILYRWSVAVVVDPQNRSEDIVANGLIKRIDPAPMLSGQLEKAAPQDKAALYAGSGIWYDALQSISDQIDHAPMDASLHDARDELLKQIGMDGATMEPNAFKAP